MSTEGTPRPIEGVRVLPLAAPPAPQIEAVLRALSRRLAVPVRLGAPPPGFTLPRLPGRPQLDADAALDRLEGLSRAEDEVIVGVTPRDIGHPIFTFFFGRARHGGGAVLVSTARLDPAFYGLPSDDEVALRRLVLEILHEMGHVAGLPHCDDSGCLMRFCTSVEAIDNRGATYCPPCSRALPAAFDALRTAPPA